MNPFRISPLALGCLLTCAGLAAWSGAALAQEAPAAGRSSGLSPSLSASVGYQRGSGLVGGVDDGEFVTRVSPGLNWSSRAGRVRGSVDYALDAVQYSGRADSSEISHRLSSTLNATLVEERAFVEVAATAGQVAISANGQQYAFDPLTGDANRTQVFNLRVTPVLQGRLGNLADWQVRFGASVTDARAVDTADSNNRFALAQLTSPASASAFGWALQAQRSEVRFRDGRDTTSERVGGQLNWRPDVDWLLFITAGQERTDVGRLLRRTYDNAGGGMVWSPSPRTRVALQGERRYFGNSWGASVEYRTPRTIWRFSDTRSATEGGDPNGFSQPITLFDLFFLQFASSFPDPVQREQAVRDFLRLIGRDPNELLNIGALADAVSLQRRQELSAAWAGVRTTVTLQFFATSLRALDNPSDPANPPASRDDRQRGVTLSSSYRLTPLATLNASATYQTSPGLTLGARNELTGISFGYTSRISRFTSLTLSARHAEFTSDSLPYDDTALNASVYMRF